MTENLDKKLIFGQVRVMCCGFSKRAVYASVSMDGNESVRYCRELMVNRFKIAPKYVVYDHVCCLAHNGNEKFLGQINF